MLYCVIFYCYDIWMIHHYGSYKYDMISLHGLLRQDISSVWFDMMSVCIMSLQQVVRIWNQHGVISVWYDVISVTHDIWISYVSHHDIEDNEWCDIYHQKGTPITSSWHYIILIYHISYPILSSHHIIASHPTTSHSITSHHPIS